jgi:hypothetical protein
MSSSEALPDAKTIEKVCEFDIIDSKGVKLKFGSILADQTVVIVFVRKYSVFDGLQRLTRSQVTFFAV